uniref:hypothetical protein n=1 Tax=Klebsiella pneumoniae TaxID=573 RepID=UPI001D0E4A00|nr:hypothetical protein [Klebsiella pneumoniae]
MLTLTDIRASNTVLVTEFGGVRAVHFCLHEKLSGSDNDLWFPLANGADLFAGAGKHYVHQFCRC